jgi:hypothetical protein
VIDDQGWYVPDELDDPITDIKADLWPGESVLWSERPALPRLRRFRAIPLLFVAVVSGLSSVSLAAIFGALRPGAVPTEAVLFVVALGPLALGGLIAAYAFHGLCGWAARRWALARTVYAITDQRVIIGRYDSRRRLTFFSLIPGMIADTSSFEYADGTGDLLFEGVQLSTRRAVGFFGIHGVRSVDRLLHETLIDPFPRW